MSMEFTNKICPNCKNANYMVLLGDLSKACKYKCMNCNRYFNDIDFEEQIQPVWKSECMNEKVDMEEVVRCKYCKKRSTPDCKVWLNGIPQSDNWFCADGKRKEGW